MATEKEKMLNGDLYDPLDPQLAAERRRARLLIQALDETDLHRDTSYSTANYCLPAFGT